MKASNKASRFLLISAACAGFGLLVRLVSMVLIAAAYGMFEALK